MWVVPSRHTGMLAYRVMRPGRVRTWEDWFHEVFLRGGLFSLRRMPQTAAELNLRAEAVVPPRGVTKLNLADPDATQQAWAQRRALTDRQTRLTSYAPRASGQNSGSANTPAPTGVSV